MSDQQDANNGDAGRKKNRRRLRHLSSQDSHNSQDSKKKAKSSSKSEVVDLLDSDDSDNFELSDNENERQKRLSQRKSTSKSAENVAVSSSSSSSSSSKRGRARPRKVPANGGKKPAVGKARNTVSQENKRPKLKQTVLLPKYNKGSVNRSPVLSQKSKRDAKKRYVRSVALAKFFFSLTNKCGVGGAILGIFQEHRPCITTL